MEVELKFDSQWRPSPQDQVHFCGHLRCPMKHVPGGELPGCPSDRYLNIVVKTKERIKIHLHSSINVHDILYIKRGDKFSLLYLNTYPMEGAV